MNPIEAIKERTRQKLHGDFACFVRRAWRQIEPKELQWNWHHELVCEYLQLAYEREELRLIFCMPPRELKSRLVSVFWPAWCWAKDAGLSFILTSYSDSLSEELSVTRRNLLQSDWFQSTFPNQVRFSTDQNRREQYGNIRGGMMIATSTAGTLTGKGGDFLVVDDLLSPQQSYSDLERENANRYFDSTLRSRLNEPVRGGIIVVCQRLHEHDLPGHLIDSEPGGWTVVNMPMIAEVDEQITFPLSGRVIERKAGDLLHPARFPKGWCDKQQKTLGRLVWSSQYQQRPSPIEGNLVKASDVRYFGGKDSATGERDPDLPEEFERTIISVDCSFKDLSTSDYVALLVIGIVGSRRYVRHIVNAHLDLDGTENEIRSAHMNFGPISCVLVEDKANGSSVINHLKEEISGLIAVNPEGGKVSRMMAAAPEFQANNWFFDRTGAWTNKAIDQLCLFPNARYDDIADAVSQATIWLQANTYELGLLAYFKQIVSGKRKPPSSMKQIARGAAVKEEKPVIVTGDQAAEYVAGHPPPLCPHPDCKNPCTFLQRDHEGEWHVHCRQCGRMDGQDMVKPINGNLCWVKGCGLPLVWSGGIQRCQNHGQLLSKGNPPNGATFAYLNARKKRYWN